MKVRPAIESAYEILERSILYWQGNPVGTLAACSSESEAENYSECFVRDFVPSALVFMMDGRDEIVLNFLRSIMHLQGQQVEMEGHRHAVGLMPASFKVIHNEDGSEELVADFGDRAIGRVAPVDSAMWWIILLRAYVINKGDIKIAHSPDFQQAIRLVLQLYLHETFVTSPALLVPDASFMVDRRMGVYGHPLEIEALFYGTLVSAQELLIHNEENQNLLDVIQKRLQTLRSYVRLFYWLDVNRLNEIHRYKGEEFGLDAVNVLNIFPQSIPDWLDGWLQDGNGYMVSNVGPSRIDFRFFSLGNLLSILFGLTTDEQADQIMNLCESRWDNIMGEMPMKLCYPAMFGKEWEFRTGADPKNAPWSYHNGGSWPTLMWAFTGAAIRTGRAHLAERAFELCIDRLHNDGWPEYYDGKTGSLIGRRANLNQVWSATAIIISHQLLENPDSVGTFESIIF